MANIYSRGAVPTYSVRKSTISLNPPIDLSSHDASGSAQLQSSPVGQSDEAGPSGKSGELSKASSEQAIKINMSQPNNTEDDESDKLLK